MCPLSCRDDGSHFRVQALVAGQDSRDYAAPASVAVCTHARFHMKNDGGPVGMWLLSGNQGACTQLLCLPYGISRPAFHSLPFFSSYAAPSTGTEWR